MKTTWADAPDESLRRAAAGVCGLRDNHPFGDEWWEDESRHRYWKQADGNLDYGEEVWWPTTNRDQLARVFVAVLGKFGKLEPVEQNYIVEAWWDAMDDPRYALIQLLDLLQVEAPRE